MPVANPPVFVVRIGAEDRESSHMEAVEVTYSSGINLSIELPGGLLTWSGSATGGAQRA